MSINSITPLMDILSGNSKNKKIVNVILIVVSLLLILLFFVFVGHNSSQGKGKHLKCKVCGKGFKYQTWLGDFYGNHCTNGSFGDVIEDCGSDSACFKMNNILSNASKYSMTRWSKWLKKQSHHFSDHFLYSEGTIRGCIRGFGWRDSCHFYNSSYYLDPDYEHASLYWQANNVCVCTTDNCN